MTRKEAIEWLEKAKAETTAIAKDIPTTGEYANSLITAIELVNALDMAIEALEQEPVLNKIRTEIEQIEINGYIRDIECFRAGIDAALNVINKYKKRREK